MDMERLRRALFQYISLLIGVECKHSTHINVCMNLDTALAKWRRQATILHCATFGKILGNFKYVLTLLTK